MSEDREKKAVQKLKKRMEGDMESEMYEDDNLFLKFIIARDFNIDHAEVMLRDHLKWRDTYDVNNISKYKPPEVLEKYFSMVFLGHDKHGHVLRYVPSGNFDCKGLLASCNLEDWKKCMIYGFEEDLSELKKQSEKLGRLVDKVVYIHDLEHFTLSKATDKNVISCLFSFIDLYANNYPEMLHAAYAINAPVYFKILFSLMKRILPSKVIQKVNVYSDDSWKAEILNNVDAEILPVFLGGTKTDPDGNPECNTFKNRAGLVPETYYIQKNKEKERSFSSLPGSQKITVSRSSCQEVVLELTEAGYYLEWEFVVKSDDIRFGILYQATKEKRVELIPLQKITADESPKKGSYICEKAGIYTVQFDNTYSYLRSKEIQYKIKLTSPKEETHNLINKDPAYMSEA